MIPDIHYTPKRQNATPIIIVSALMAVFLVCLVLRAFEIWNKLFFEIILVVSALAMIFVYVRFLTTVYTYTVNYEDNLFIVVQRTGRRLTTLCRLDLSALYRIRPYEEDDKTEERHASRYSYCVTFRPKMSYLAFFDDGEHIVSIRLELDDTFYGVLSRVAEGYTAREEEDYGDEEDELPPEE